MNRLSEYMELSVDISKVTVRPYNPDDACACRSLWTDLVQTHRDLYEDQSIGGDDPGIHFDSYLRSPALAGVWVADYRMKVLGLTGLLIEGDEGELEPLVVARAYRNQQVGKMLVDQVMCEARQRGLRYLNVRPVARNAAAIRFFVFSGFSVAGRLELFMDLQAPEKDWKEGFTLHGLKIRF